MLADLERLQTIVPPPAKPVGSEGNWEQIEAELGLQLPSDYKQYISLYGAGTISGIVSVGNPFIQPVSARRFWENWVDIYRDIAAYGTDVPYDLYPESPGLLPCASCFDVNIINWLTAPESGIWKLIVFNHVKGFIDCGKMSLVEFIIDFLTDPSRLPREAVDGVPVIVSKEFVVGYSFG